MTNKQILYDRLYTAWKDKFSLPLRRRRLRYINKKIYGGKLFDKQLMAGKKIVEIGCSSGKDFIQFFEGYGETEIIGVDVQDYGIKQANFVFHQVDAETLSFEDKSIDLTVSFGTLEHIQPIEKLCKVISEINRVSKEYIILVPSISTFFEPHTNSFFWPIRQKGKKHLATSLNYFSDEAWLQFGGFTNAKITRFNYFPGLISNSIIYSTGILE